MKTAGIIAEYNPFHKGHEYHIAETRRVTGADFVVAVMSGNFTQRGIPACLDKFTRAECALACGADVVLEVAGAPDTFQLAWQLARPNAIVTVVALYDRPQILPLPQMYGKNLTFKTGGVDGCDCAEILTLIEAGKIDTTPLITHTYALRDIEEAYRVFENRLDGVIKIAIRTEA